MAFEVKRTDADDWQSTLAYLKAGFDAGDPVVIEQAHTIREKLDRQISALEIQQAIRARTLLDGKFTPDYAQQCCAAIQNQIEPLLARSTDLRPILKRGARLQQQQSAPGANPARVNHPVENSLEGIPEALKTAAMDLQWGWAVLVGKTQPKDGGYEPKEPSGGEPGSLSVQAEQQYLDWVKEMHRQRMSPWAVEDVVCQNRSWMESAKLRGSGPDIVRLLVLAGLSVYQGMFKPLDRRE